MTEMVVYWIKTIKHLLKISSPMDSAQKPSSIFISYSSPDLARALLIKQTLAQAGLSAWHAGVDLEAGARLSAIHDHIAKSRYALFLLSESSLNSRWVQHELNIAVAAHLQGRDMTVIPVQLDDSDLPAALVDFKALDLRPDVLEIGLASLVSRIRGEPQPLSRLEAFRDYVGGLIEISDSAYASILNVSCQLGYSTRTGIRDDVSRWGLEAVRDNEVLHDRVRQSILKTLSDEGVATADCARAETAMVSAKPVPVIGRNAKKKLAQWIRLSDDSMVAFATSLSKERSLSRYRYGITLEWVKERLRAGREDEDIVDWQAGTIIQRALRLGLLGLSTESFGNDLAKQDACANPSYDFGPLLAVIEPVLCGFELVCTTSRSRITIR